MQASLMKAVHTLQLHNSHCATPVSKFQRMKTVTANQPAAVAQGILPSDPGHMVTAKYKRLRGLLVV